MAYLITSSLAEPSPYALYRIPNVLAPGQQHVMWNNISKERIRPECQPQSVLQAIYQADEYYGLYSPDFSFAEGGPCLSEGVRELIETLEPGVHQFFPVEMLNPDGSVREPRRYLLNVCQTVSAVVDGTYSVLSDGTRFYLAHRPMKVRKDIISNLHLWRDSGVDFQHYFVSGELYNKLNEAGFGGFQSAFVEEM